MIRNLFFDLLELTSQTLIFEYCVNLLFIKKKKNHSLESEH